jgi:CRISPR-associated protein Cas2
MIITAYDIASDKDRTRFSKFLGKFGRRLQYSVFEIRNSTRVKQNIKKEIEHRYKKRFAGGDSVVIFDLCEGCKKKVNRYGYACNDEKDVVIFE